MDSRGRQRTWIRSCFFPRVPSGVAIYVIPLLAALALTAPHLDQGGYRKDTGRYAAVGLQAWRDGQLQPFELAPGEAYAAKPPLAILSHGLVLHAFGVSVWACRAPTVCMAVVSVLCVVFIGRRLGGASVGLASGLSLAMTYEFFRRTREISLDMWQLALMLCAVAIVVWARERKGAWALAAGVPVGLALLVKPLVGLVCLALLGVWLALERRWTLVAWVGGAAVVAVGVAAPWHVWMAATQGEAFTDAYFGKEIADRAAGKLTHETEIGPRGGMYYISILLRMCWPWLAFAGLGVVSLVRRVGGRDPARSLRVLALVWGIGWLALISVFPDKHPRYALPVYPAVALLAGIWIALDAPAWFKLPLRRTRRFGAVVFAALGLGIAVAPVKLQAGRAAGWGELSSEIESRGISSLVGVGVGSNDRATFALDQGWWPVEGSFEDARGGFALLKSSERGFVDARGDVVWESSDGLFRLVRVPG